MSEVFYDLKVGQLTHHPVWGEGVINSLPANGYISVFFKNGGEKQVEVSSLSSATERLGELFSSLHVATQTEINQLDLAVEAESIPLMDNKTELTSAKIDILPHQVVLVHRVANAKPRRFLIADEVGLGKTIETALILRELASRGEMKRALIIVPAGLVENWRRELNDVFHLDFAVFGKEDDDQDKQSNPFEKHNRLIGSIDTLKRKDKVKKNLNSPLWDVIVFDEAHHLTVRMNGMQRIKTKNYMLAEALLSHCRDLLLLSATPHQGDNYRFLMLIKLLNPNLFADVCDMQENRYRLNTVVIRRTKADACTVDGEPLFARRQVYSKCFKLSDEEYSFYKDLLNYLERGYACEERKVGKKKALGLVMSTFQKIASSSFCALSYTIRRRLVVLLAIEISKALRDNPQNQDCYVSLQHDAEQYIKEIYHLENSDIGDAMADYLFQKIIRKIQHKKTEDDNLIFEEESDNMADFESDSEYEADDLDTEETLDDLEDDEMSMLQDLLYGVPGCNESKLSALKEALLQIWKDSPREQVIIFTTYLGSVEIIENMLKIFFPNKGVVVLKGGDQDEKTNIQKKFKQADGPLVLVCTAAGREGINLQSAKILFNYDLPWNPMELEQRIGRIHRYGQKETAQVYNLVAINTLEGKIFNRLRDKIKTIAEILGKVDKNGQIAEDFEIQILGFLQEKINFRRLYRDAIKDRTLKRTEQELDVALKNALNAKEVVSSLFQDLDGFNLEDYKKCTDKGKNMARLAAFIVKQAKFSGYQHHVNEDGFSELKNTTTEETSLFTKDRKKALDNDSLQLFGLEHPIVKQMLQDASSIPLFGRALICKSEEDGIVVFWKVSLSSDGKEVTRIVKVGLSESGEYNKSLEKALSIDPLDPNFAIPQCPPALAVSAWNALVHEIEEKEILSEKTTFSALPIAVYYLQKRG